MVLGGQNADFLDDKQQRNSQSALKNRNPSPVSRNKSAGKDKLVAYTTESHERPASRRINSQVSEIVDTEHEDFYSVCEFKGR